MPSGSSVRVPRECLEHMIVFNAAHLQRVLQAYAAYYNLDRPHMALGKYSPLGRPIERQGRVVSRPVAGGLHRRYARTRPK